MRLRSKLITPLLALTALSSAASAAVIGGTYYAPQYDYASSSLPPTAAASR